MTKDPKTNEFIMILQLASAGNLRCILANNFSSISWDDKIKLLSDSTQDLSNLHNLGYSHKDFHSGNILQDCNNWYYISDFGLSGPANKEKSDDKIYGILP